MDELDKAEKDPEIGALVITGGDPKFFSNGLDLDWLMANAGDMDKVLGYLGLVNSMLKRWTLYPKPTVAALNGHTFAAGLFMAAHTVEVDQLLNAHGLLVGGEGLVEAPQ